MRSAHPFPIARPSTVLLVLALAVLVSPARAATKPGRANRAVATGASAEGQRAVLGGVLAITAAGRADVTDPSRVQTAVTLALDEATRLEGALAPGGGSELARLNRSAAGERFACSADLYEALDAARALAAETGGAFDPTIGALVDAWDLRGGGRTPGADELAAARDLVGWRQLLLAPEARTARFLRPGVTVALDAVAGGVVLAHAADVLRARGIARARLDLGGDVLAFTRHEPWLVSVAGPDGQPAVSLALANAACATVVQPGPAAGRGDGPAPVVDPRTGRLAPGDVSVTVVAPSASRARALAEALVVMGRSEAAAFARAHPDLGVLWLEPSAATLRAWAWNLGALEPAPDVIVEWQDRD